MPRKVLDFHLLALQRKPKVAVISCKLNVHLLELGGPSSEGHPSNIWRRISHVDIHPQHCMLHCIYCDTCRKATWLLIFRISLSGSWDSSVWVFAYITAGHSYKILSVNMLHHSLPHHDQRAYTVVGWVWLLRLDVWAPYKLVCGGDRALDQAL